MRPTRLTAERKKRKKCELRSRTERELLVSFEHVLSANVLQMYLLDVLEEQNGVVAVFAGNECGLGNLRVLDDLLRENLDQASYC